MDSEVVHFEGTFIFKNFEQGGPFPIHFEFVSANRTCLEFPCPNLPYPPISIVMYILVPFDYW